MVLYLGKGFVNAQQTEGHCCKKLNWQVASNWKDVKECAYLKENSRQN